MSYPSKEHLIQKLKEAREKDPKEPRVKYLDVQQIANESGFWLKIHSAILYGLIDGELPNQEKCLHYLKVCERHNVFPDEDYISPEFNVNTHKRTDKCK